MEISDVLSDKLTAGESEVLCDRSSTTEKAEKRGI